MCGGLRIDPSSSPEGGRNPPYPGGPRHPRGRYSLKNSTGEWLLMVRTTFPSEEVITISAPTPTIRWWQCRSLPPGTGPGPSLPHHLPNSRYGKIRRFQKISRRPRQIPRISGVPGGLPDSIPLTRASPSFFRPDMVTMKAGLANLSFPQAPIRFPRSKEDSSCFSKSATEKTDGSMSSRQHTADSSRTGLSPSAFRISPEVEQPNTGNPTEEIVEARSGIPSATELKMIPSAGRNPEKFPDPFGNFTG